MSKSSLRKIDALMGILYLVGTVFIHDFHARVTLEHNKLYVALIDLSENQD